MREGVVKCQGVKAKESTLIWKVHQESGFLMGKLLCLGPNCHRINGPGYRESGPVKMTV